MECINYWWASCLGWLLGQCLRGCVTSSSREAFSEEVMFQWTDKRMTSHNWQHDPGKTKGRGNIPDGAKRFSKSSTVLSQSPQPKQRPGTWWPRLMCVGGSLSGGGREAGAGRRGTEGGECYNRGSIQPLRELWCQNGWSEVFEVKAKHLGPEALSTLAHRLSLG